MTHLGTCPTSVSFRLPIPSVKRKQSHEGQREQHELYGLKAFSVVNQNWPSIDEGKPIIPESASTKQVHWSVAHEMPDQLADDIGSALNKLGSLNDILLHC